MSPNEESVDWLTRILGFAERVRTDDHRAQMAFGDGAVIMADATHGRSSQMREAAVTHLVLVRVHDSDAPHRHVRAPGEHVASEPVNLPFGERQYSVVDPVRHLWTFTESIADPRPENWGGTTVGEW